MQTTTSARTVTVYQLFIDGIEVYRDTSKDYRDDELVWYLQHEDFAFYSLDQEEVGDED